MNIEIHGDNANLSLSVKELQEISTALSVYHQQGKGSQETSQVMAAKIGNALQEYYKTHG
jgi:hypothetical protein